MIQLKDVIHFYLGCQIMAGNETGEFNAFTLKGQCGVGFGYNYKAIKLFKIEEVKLILRPLTSMTNEEMKECGNLDYNFSDEPELNNWTPDSFFMLTPNQFQWLISRCFDLFELIPSGQAIDKTTLTP